MQSYRFDLIIDFDSHIDLKEFEQEIGLVASRLYERIHYRGNIRIDRKKQSYSLYSKDYKDYYLSSGMSEFLSYVAPKVINVLPTILEPKGSVRLCVVLDSHDFSDIAIDINQELVFTLAKMHASLDFDTGLFE